MNFLWKSSLYCVTTIQSMYSNILHKYQKHRSFFECMFIPSLMTSSFIGWCLFTRYLKYQLECKTQNLSDTNRSSYHSTNTNFVEARKKQFHAFFSQPNANDNIEPDMYDHEQYNKMIFHSPNVEKKWKSRILIDSTPIGNVMMHYDVYKHGFVYLSDQTIPYTILCGTAMKYCVVFFCRDFFRDNQYIPEHNLSPFTQIDLDLEKKEKEKAKQKRKNIGIDFQSDAFLKPKPTPPKPDPLKPPAITKTTKHKHKNVNFVDNKSDNIPDNESNQTYYKNIFQFLGKTTDQKFLQKYELPNHPTTTIRTNSYLEYKTKKAKNIFSMFDSEIDMNVVKYG